jgi:uncharacterized repeat protein (TIGR03803 family)
MMSSAKITQSLLLLFVGLAALPSSSASAQTYTVLYSFTGEADGAMPKARLMRDSAGNLYGTTYGVNFPGQGGSVFKLSPSGKFTLLHNFGAGGVDGGAPAAPVVEDSAGNLFSTTTDGGLGLGSGYGTVFKIDKKHNFSLFYSFPGGADGQSPYGQPIDLTIDSAGNLYGAADGGTGKCPNNSGCGVIFKLDPDANETVLHTFLYGKKGSYPSGGLLRDAAGNLYGTTVGIFNVYSSIVFKLDTSNKETVLYTFNFKGQESGPEPTGDLIRDSSGNLYGTTRSGGVQQGRCKYDQVPCGSVFKLDPSGNETTLYDFTGEADGWDPNPGLVMDAAGNLYGTTGAGGDFNCVVTGCGVVFKLSPSGHETVVHTFHGGTDGDGPAAGVIMDGAGILYGTTSSGGNISDCQGGGCGVVFKIKP